MWLIRFHLIETRDYNRVDRILEGVGFSSRKFSNMLLTKGVLLYVLQGKSWRLVASELRMDSHIPLYQFYTFMRTLQARDKLIEYMIERRIALSVKDEGHITYAVLDSDAIVSESLVVYRNKH